MIADEAHRSQYDFIDGFARHMRDALPNASFIGFTGTPIETARRQHPRCVRRLHQRLRHRARGGGRRHRPIYYESRLAKLALVEAERPKIDADFEEATEGEEVDAKKSSRANGRSSKRWSAPRNGSS